MKSILVEVCMGTTCFVMGAAALSELSETLEQTAGIPLEVRNSPCMGLCHHEEYGQAPYAKVNGEVICSATAQKIEAKVKALAQTT